MAIYREKHGTIRVKKKKEERNIEEAKGSLRGNQRREEERKLNLAKENQAKSCTFGEFKVRGRNFHLMVFLC